MNGFPLSVAAGRFGFGCWWGPLVFLSYRISVPVIMMPMKEIKSI